MALAPGEAKKAWYRRNRAVVLAKQKAVREANKEKVAAYRLKSRPQERIQEKLTREARRLAGLCMRCGGVLPANGRVYCVACNAAARERRRALMARMHPTMGVQAMNLKKEWGLTLEQWTKMFDAQGRRCPICLSDTPGAAWWHLDHDHALKKKDPRSHRGILCHKCNHGLGLFRDDPTYLERALAYLTGKP